MYLKQLDITNVRNLRSATIEPHTHFNIFYGKNGSGKTSVLEAIHILGLGKSFRHHQIDSTIHYDSAALSVVGQLMSAEKTYPVGIEKQSQGKTTIRINGESANSAAKLAEVLPQQLIHPDSDQLISGSPKLRRQFLDWGLFHVEQNFFPAWQRLQKILKQRNAALKFQQSREYVSSWDGEYVIVCEEISKMRKSYIEQLQPLFSEMIKFLLAQPPVEIAYQRGWQASDLLSLLQQSYNRDMQLGYTQLGPQRDDMRVFSGEYAVEDVFSRGEQKLVVIALRLAQGKLLRQITSKNCLYLLDDFAAELDAVHRHKVIEILSNLGSQVFLTTIDVAEVKEAIDFVQPRLFHVEQGRIKQV
jgi:DNA replication and repair protein RecF